jgi:hypothetical protein
MKASPLILGGLFFLIGMCIYLGTYFPANETTNLFGFSILDSDLHAAQAVQ